MIKQQQKQLSLKELAWHEGPHNLINFLLKNPLSETLWYVNLFCFSYPRPFYLPQGLLAVPRDHHLGGLPGPTESSVPLPAAEGDWDQENSFSQEAWCPQQAEARLGYGQGAGKRPRCGWRAYITGRRLPSLPFPWSKFTSLTLADKGMVVPGQPFPPLEVIDLHPNPQCSASFGLDFSPPLWWRGPIFTPLCR